MIALSIIGLILSIKHHINYPFIKHHIEEKTDLSCRSAKTSLSFLFVSGSFL